MEPSPDNRVGLPDCLTNKCWHVILSEPPKGDEQDCIFMLHLSYSRISRCLTSFIYRDQSLIAEGRHLWDPIWQPFYSIEVFRKGRGKITSQEKKVERILCNQTVITPLEFIWDACVHTPLFTDPFFWLDRSKKSHARVMTLLGLHVWPVFA